MSENFSTLERERDMLVAEITRLRAQLAKAKKALRPFAHPSAPLSVMGETSFSFQTSDLSFAAEVYKELCKELCGE